MPRVVFVLQIQEKKPPRSWHFRGRDHRRVTSSGNWQSSASLRTQYPGFGRDVAIDASDLPAFANGQRYVSKGGKERERFSDPDASWGHRSAVSTRKGGGFYGFKIHAAVCSATGLPLAWRVETGRAHEAPFALPLVDASRARGFAVETCALD